MIGYFPGYKDGRGHWVIARSRCCGLGLVTRHEDTHGISFSVVWDGSEERLNEIFCSNCNAIIWKKSKNLLAGAPVTVAWKKE